MALTPSPGPGSFLRIFSQHIYTSEAHIGHDIHLPGALGFWSQASEAETPSSPSNTWLEFGGWPRVQILPTPFTGCVIMGKLSTLSGPQSVSLTGK